jgi:hypothetical protein
MMEGFVEETVVRARLGSGGASASLLRLAGETWEFAAAVVEENPVVVLAEPLRRETGMGRLKSVWGWRLERSQPGEGEIGSIVLLSGKQEEVDT